MPPQAAARGLALLVLAAVAVASLSAPGCLDARLPTGSTEWQTSVAGSAIVVQWGYGNKTCSSMNSCFGLNLTADRRIVPQLMPVQIQEGIAVRFLLNEHRDLNLSVRLYRVEEAAFRQCDVAEGRLITATETTVDRLVDSGPLQPGSNYFTAATSDPLFQCHYGLRLNVTVKPSDCVCAPGGVLCSRRGRCLTGLYAPSYTCRCCDGWTGRCCEKQHICAREPCHNGATCVRTDTPTAYRCVCRTGFYGDTCQYSNGSGLCDVSPCVHGGSCVGDGAAYFCRCPPGYWGRHCESEVNECESEPCRRGACDDRVDGYACLCEPGYSGVNCDVERKPCASQPCEHDGVCRDADGDYFCVCDRGYTGMNCELKVNLCEPNPCQNATECVDLGREILCSCKAGFTGSYCDVDTDECASGPCLNGGRCTDLVASYRCLCRRHYSGTHCQFVVSKSVDVPEALNLYDDAPLRNLTRLQSMYIAAGTLCGALLLALVILICCYLKTRRPRALQDKERTRVDWPSQAHCGHGKRRSTSVVFDTSDDGRRGNTSVSVPLVDPVRTRRM